MWVCADSNEIQLYEFQNSVLTEGSVRILKNFSMEYKVEKSTGWKILRTLILYNNNGKKTFKNK